MSGISKRVRFEIFKRDLFTCAYCGGRPPEVVLQVDHIIAKAAGGSNEPDNLTTSCASCNLGKSDKSLGSTRPIVDELARLGAIQEMNERAVLLKQQSDVLQQQKDLEDEGVRIVLSWWVDLGGDEAAFTERSVRQFLRYLDLNALWGCMDATERKWDQRGRMGASEAWRYFCGCCWKLIKAVPGGEK